jgi:cytochrome c553
LADETVIADPLSPYKGQRIVDVGAKLYRGGDAARSIPACTACHGPAGRGVPGPSYPSLGGQHAGYTTNVLKLFKATPAGAPALKDPNYVIMADVAARLTDEEILALSSYLEGLHNRADAAPATAQN